MKAQRADGCADALEAVPRTRARSQPGCARKVAPEALTGAAERLLTSVGWHLVEKARDKLG